MRCYRCGQSVEQGDQFCRLCGVEFLPAPTEASRRFDAGRPRTILSMFGVGIVVAALLWVVYKAIEPFRGDGKDPVAVELATLSPVATSIVVGPGATATTVTVTTLAPTTAPPTVAIAPPGPLKVGEVKASCTARNSTDSRGNSVSFAAGNTVDGDNNSAWRCPGRGVGKTLTFIFARPNDITGIATIPGYDRVDPFTGQDRFPQNRRVAAVRWSCVDAAGKVVATGDQQFRDDRNPQSFAPKGFVRCTAIQAEILQSTRSGSRDFVAISEIAIAGRPTR